MGSFFSSPQPTITPPIGGRGQVDHAPLSAQSLRFGDGLTFVPNSPLAREAVIARAGA